MSRKNLSRVEERDLITRTIIEYGPQRRKQMGDRPKAVLNGYEIREKLKLENKLCYTLLKQMMSEQILSIAYKEKFRSGKPKIYYRPTEFAFVKYLLERIPNLTSGKSDARFQISKEIPGLYPAAIGDLEKIIEDDPELWPAMHEEYTRIKKIGNAQDLFRCFVYLLVFLLDEDSNEKILPRANEKVEGPTNEEISPLTKRILAWLVVPFFALVYNRNWESRPPTYEVGGWALNCVLSSIFFNASEPEIDRRLDLLKGQIAAYLRLNPDRSEEILSEAQESADFERLRASDFDLFIEKLEAGRS